MKLHYSQTKLRELTTHKMFQYLMKLHYSQTQSMKIIDYRLVSVPYEITLLSNTAAERTAGE